jgi:predicted amidohydrolase
MKLAAAQINSTPQNTEANIRNHIRMIDLAADQGVGFMLFPEMSLTGYERELASEMSFSENDRRLAVFEEMAIKHKMIIVVGAPIKIETELFIGSFVFAPNGSSNVYTKQYLHQGEEKFFVPGFVNNPLIEMGGEKVSIAICADLVNSLHPEQAAKKKTTVYAASIFYTPGGIGEAHEQLGSYAKKYNMQVLMANYAGSSYGLQSAGKSAYWNNRGELIGELNHAEEGLLVITTDKMATAT